MDNGILKFRVPPQKQTLGPSTVQTAQIVHTCCHCDIPILPGDRYERQPYIYHGYERDYAWVEKWHLPECPGDPDGDRALKEIEDRLDEEEGCTEPEIVRATFAA